MAKVLKEFVNLFHQHLKKQGKVTLWVSLVIGVLVFFEAVTWVKSEPASITDPRVLQSVRNIKAGEPINLIDFTFRFANKNEGVTFLTDQDLHLLNGAVLIKEVNKGEPIQLNNLIMKKDGGGFSNKIPKGMRAYSIQPFNTVPLRSGDKIDVVWSRGKENEMPMTLISAAMVLRQGNIQGKETVLIAVDEHDLPVLEKAREYGKLTIALRNPEENGPVHSSLDARRHPFLNNVHIRKVEVISEEEK